MRLGLLGCGNVGSSLVQLIFENQGSIKEKSGESIELAAIVIRDPKAFRPNWIPKELLTTDAMAVINDPSIDVIVEVMGGIHPAKEYVEAALRAKKSVITANKSLLAESYFELEELADSVGRDIFFEAAVAGGIPLIRSLRVSLAGEKLKRVIGIVNGTTNFILTRMDEEGLSYDVALELARQLGYAEADPRADIEGIDAASKAAILASIAFGKKVRFKDVSREGITKVTASDFEFARRHGYTIKLLALCEKLFEDEEYLDVRVFPALVPKTHPLASVRDAFNAVFVEGDAVGELMFYGRGAGGAPTASAVLGDIMDAAHNLRFGSTERRIERKDVVMAPVERLSGSFLIAVDVNDAPGVLAQVATVFGENGVSINSMEQLGFMNQARLIFLTHDSLEQDVMNTLAKLEELDCVRSLRQAMRVLSEED